MERIDIHNIEEKSREIIKNDFFTVKYLYFDAGKSLLSQTEQAMALIQVIEGTITFVYEKEGKSFLMPQNTILEFDAREPYSIIAHQNSKILIITTNNIMIWQQK